MERTGELAAAMSLPGVLSAALLPYRARLDGGPDLEIAVWLDPRLRYLKRVELRLDLIDAAQRVLEIELVEVLVLNHSSEPLREWAQRNGRALQLVPPTQAGGPEGRRDRRGRSRGWRMPAPASRRRPRIRSASELP